LARRRRGPGTIFRAFTTAASRLANSASRGIASVAPWVHIQRNIFLRRRT
jgi:hypothetical protein